MVVKTGLKIAAAAGGVSAASLGCSKMDDYEQDHAADTTDEDTEGQTA